MTIGEKIKDLRKLNNLTQVELAKKSNISRSYLADIEKDRYTASLETLKSIAQSLNVPVSTFLDEETENKERDYSLTKKEHENIDSEAKKIIDELSMSFSKNKDILTEEDYFAIENALKITLESIKIKNKKKFTPKKYK